MKRLDPILLKVFLYGLPLVAGFGVFSYFYSVGVVKNGSDYVGFLNGLAGLVIATWMTLSIYLSLKLIVSGLFRDQVIAKITFIRERDEREAILTGKATKTAFLTSLAFVSPVSRFPFIGYLWKKPLMAKRVSYHWGLASVFWNMANKIAPKI
jgi:hypothetical protein